jgi:hypothetical protein
MSELDLRNPQKTKEPRRDYGVWGTPLRFP